MKYKKKDVVIGILTIVIIAFGVVNIILGLPDAVIRGPISKTLVVGTLSPYVLDPVDSEDLASNLILEQVVETLFSYNLSDHMTPRIPLLAETYWWENLTTLHIKLKEGIMFQDLTPFDANATKWNLDRMLYFFNCTGELPSNMSVGEPFSLYYFSDGVTPIISSVVSDGAYNVTIFLNGAFSPFLDLLCYTAGAMLSPTSTPIDHYINLTYGRVIGTGPFIYEYYIPNVEVSLGRFDYYWQGPAFFEEVVMVSITDTTTRNNAMLNHEIDWLIAPNPSLYPIFEADPAIHVERFTEKYGIPSLVYQYLGMNNKLINVTWRKAISYAINYTYIIEELLNNAVVRANSPISPGYGYAYNASNAAADYDLITARQIIVDNIPAATGFPVNNNPSDPTWLGATLTSFNYTYNIPGSYREYIYYPLTGWLSAIGIQLIEGGITWSEYRDRLFIRHDYLELFWIG
ncbi:MAG: ABC transporter substrate-binding protein, partial [Promethearchaeota archaeon]